MKARWLAGFLVGLGGCSTVPDWVPSMLRGTQADTETAGHYQFNWTLSGDRSVSPLQVFDDGRRTWLQFSPGQAVPAVFREHGGGDIPVAYTVKNPYVVLPGVWPRLSFRGGARQGQAVRGGANPHAAVPARVAPEASPADVSAASPVPLAESFAVSSGTNVSVKAEKAPKPLLLAPAGRPSDVARPPPYAVSPADGTLRGALSRWAGSSGWTFQPEHWAVDVDIPISGSASFSGNFTQAVEALVAATELSDRPLQPCFYANQVLRVVPYAQLCDRSAGSLPRAS